MTIDRLARTAMLGVAAFRITRLLQKDTIFREWRETTFYPRFPYKGAMYASGDLEKTPLYPPSEGWVPVGTMPNGAPRLLHQTGTFVGNAWHCPWCLSVWVSIFLTIRKNPWKWFIDCVTVAGFAMVARGAAGDTASE